MIEQGGRSVSSSTIAAIRRPRRGCGAGREPYLRRLSNDPWNRPYLYAAPGRERAALRDHRAWAPTGARAAAEKMPTSPAELTAGGTLLAFAGDGRCRALAAVEGGGVSARGGRTRRVDLPAGTRTALAVPGAEVAIHWLALAEGLTPAQAAAAARLMLADASAEAARRHACRGRRGRSAG